MRTLFTRLAFCWYFVAGSLGSLSVAAGAISSGLGTNSPIRRLTVLGLDLALLIVAAFFAYSSLLIWRDRNCENVRGGQWVISASAISVIGSFGLAAAVFSRESVSVFLRTELILMIPQIVGIVGILTFSGVKRKNGGRQGSDTNGTA